jgi:hypothetical protein
MLGLRTWCPRCLHHRGASRAYEAGCRRVGASRAYEAGCRRVGASRDRALTVAAGRSASWPMDAVADGFPSPVAASD